MPQRKGYDRQDIDELCKKHTLDEAFRIFHEAQEYDSLLEIICFKQDEFENDGGAVVALVKKEGIRIDFL